MGVLARRSDAPELMDTDCRDYDDYRACLRDLGRVNTVTRTHAPMLRWLARAGAGMDAFSLLDVACGFGDGLRAVARWAARRGATARLAGIDLNPWAIRAARETVPDATLIQGDVFAHAPSPPPDFIVSSQFAHHLDNAAIARLLRWMDAHAARGWLVIDPRRHWFPYRGFPLLARAMFWHRFVRLDGQVSVARSLTVAEWREVVAQAGFDAAEVTVGRCFPFRIAIGRVR